MTTRNNKPFCSGLLPCCGLRTTALLVHLQGGLMPGQHHTPIRIGRDLHPLLALDEAAANNDTARAKESAAESAANSIGSREVAGISASKYFSVLRSSSGEVWTCGGELCVAKLWVSQA